MSDLTKEFDWWSKEIEKRPKTMDSLTLIIKELGNYADRMRDALEECEEIITEELGEYRLPNILRRQVS